MEYRLIDLQYELGDKYWLQACYDNNKYIGWELYNTNIYNIREDTKPIMTSETHTFQELKKYVTSHRTYTMFDYYNRILWTTELLLWVNLIIRSIWKQLNTDMMQGIFYGSFIVWFFDCIIYCVLSYRNSKHHRMYMREKYEHDFRIREDEYKEYEQMGDNK